MHSYEKAWRCQRKVISFLSSARRIQTLPYHLPSDSVDVDYNNENSELISKQIDWICYCSYIECSKRNLILFVFCSSSHAERDFYFSIFIKFGKVSYLALKWKIYFFAGNGTPDRPLADFFPKLNRKSEEHCQMAFNSTRKPIKCKWFLYHLSTHSSTCHVFNVHVAEFHLFCYLCRRFKF